MQKQAVQTLGGWNFDNTYARLDERLASRLDSVPVADPELVLFNEPLAEMLGLVFRAQAASTRNPRKVPGDRPQNESASRPEDGPAQSAPTASTRNPDESLDAALLLSGNKLPPGSEPIAQAYAGHQFGHFTMLGDGRAIVLGEQIAPDGSRYDIQFKGSGRTPFSRGGDGRATLYSMLREYLISEAMHALGIPTSRSLAVVRTGEQVFREVVHEGAVLTRVSSSHIRVGTFQYARLALPAERFSELIRYTIRRHDPDLAESETPAADLLVRVMERQAALVARWMQVGFIHGVMNTDNMSLAGETFDYGPCAFMNAYDPGTVFSSIDAHGRYAFGNQPQIAHWNLSRLAEALLPAIDADEKAAIDKANDLLRRFTGMFESRWMDMMARKLGFPGLEASDRPWVDGLLEQLRDMRADYTNSFLALQGDLVDEALLLNADSPREALDRFGRIREQWQARLRDMGIPMEEAAARMRTANPAVIPRNHLVEDALEEAVQHNRMEPFDSLLTVLRNPWECRDEPARWQAPPPDGEGGYQTFCGT